MHIPSIVSRGLATLVASTGGRYTPDICRASRKHAIRESGHFNCPSSSALGEERFPALRSSIDLHIHAVVAILPGHRPAPPDVQLSSATDCGRSSVTAVWRARGCRADPAGRLVLGAPRVLSAPAIELGSPNRQPRSEARETTRGYSACALATWELSAVPGFGHCTDLWARPRPLREDLLGRG